MDQLVEQRIRALARPLWESAARPYGMAIDFWLMAEQMVLEVMATTSRLQETAVTEAPQPFTELPEAMPVDQVRKLAQCMWESAGRQYGMAQDFWLAAERHVTAMMRAAAATSGAGEAVEPWIRDLPRLSPAAYMERIRVAAYHMWEAAGHQYGRTFDFWLEAEKQTLATLARAAAQPPEPSDDVIAAAHENQRQRQAAIAEELKKKQEHLPEAGTNTRVEAESGNSVKAPVQMIAEPSRQSREARKINHP